MGWGYGSHGRFRHEGVCPENWTLSDARLLRAAADVSDGRYDANLGGGVFKQRVARAGGGKSGGFRTIILLKAAGHSFFVHGFAKSDKANVTAIELKTLKLCC